MSHSTPVSARNFYIVNEALSLASHHGGRLSSLYDFTVSQSLAVQRRKKFLPEGRRKKYNSPHKNSYYMHYESRCKFVTGPVRAQIGDGIEPNITSSSIEEYDDRLLTHCTSESLYKIYPLCPPYMINQNHMNSSVDDDLQQVYISKYFNNRFLNLCS